MREIGGGGRCDEDHTHLVDPYPGSGSTFISANVVWNVNTTPILPPYTI